MKMRLEKRRNQSIRGHFPTGPPTGLSALKDRADAHSVGLPSQLAPQPLSLQPFSWSLGARILILARIKISQPPSLIPYPDPPLLFKHMKSLGSVSSSPKDHMHPLICRESSERCESKDPAPLVTEHLDCWRTVKGRVHQTAMCIRITPGAYENAMLIQKVSGKA